MGPAGGSMLLHPLCTAMEFFDVLGLISNHYRESQHGTRRRQHVTALFQKNSKK
jgi:hypothetical protein